MKALYISIILITLLASCSERVDIDLKEAGDPILVVFAEITNEVKEHEVHITKTAPYFQNTEIPAVSDAVVTISDGTQLISLTEDSEHPGIYLTPKDFAGKVGETYKLEISNVDVNDDGKYEEYSAETVMKKSAPVNGLKVTYNSRWDGWEVGVFSYDPEETKDYYLFKVYKNGVLYTDSITNYWITDDKFFNGSYINGPMVQYFDETKDEIVNQGDTITLQLAGITEEYYTFIQNIQWEANIKVPLFSGPSANVKGNISNGALGFFSVMEVNYGSHVYDENEANE